MTRMQQRKWRRPALGIALLGLILAFVVWDRCGMHWLEPPWKPVPASAPPGFRASFSLNRTIYSLGEPIVGTLAIVNTGDRPVELDTGGDGRAGRPERFRFQALDPHGKPLPDLLQILSGSLPQGGLGGGVTLQPHEEYRVAVLLNLFVNPREPGIYRIDGTYQSRAGRFAWSGATVKMRRWTGHMNRHEAGRLFVRSGLGGIHPCLVYGLENRTSRIGELIRMAVQRPAAGNSPKSPAERNAAVCAMQALVLMPDKAAVFHALEQEIAARSKAKPDPGRDDSRLELIYQCAATPESVGLVERSLDHPDPAVAALALRTALTMGSAKALQRLPAALNSRDDLARGLAVESAFKYLTYAQGNPALRIEGLSAALAPQYEQALLEGFRRDELGSGAPMPEIILVRYLDAFNATGGRVSDAIGIAAQSPSALKHRALLRFLTTMSGLYSPESAPGCRTRGSAHALPARIYEGHQSRPGRPRHGDSLPGLLGRSRIGPGDRAAARQRPSGHPAQRGRGAPDDARPAVHGPRDPGSVRRRAHPESSAHFAGRRPAWDERSMENVRQRRGGEARNRCRGVGHP